MGPATPTGYAVEYPTAGSSVPSASIAAWSAGVDVPEHTWSEAETAGELELELRMLDRMLADASAQLTRIRELIGDKREGGT